MSEEKHLVTIKGTRDGLTLVIDDSCTFDDAFSELENKMKENYLNTETQTVAVTVKLGFRYLQQKQKKRLINLLEDKHKFIIQNFDSEVVHKKDVLTWKEESEVKVFNRIVRSGQVLKVVGDLLLVGDVNPGGKISATGNIYVMGNLLGIAHAGVSGDRQAIIAASFMNPSQLRIADNIGRSPDYESDGVYMEYGYINESKNQIMLDKMNVLTNMRQELSGLERRIQNE